MSFLEPPSAFARWAHVPSRLVFQGADSRQPQLSICIPTFRRPDLLRESVESALAQNWNGALEIVVIDNDPQSQGAERLLVDLPRLASANFRYYVNGENIGQAGNWNRGIELGRGEWHTMLHDDDLLLPDFAEAMMSALAANPRMDGLICRKRLFGPGVVETKSRSRDLAKRAFVEARFRGSETRRYRPSRFFWASGNPVGLVARKADLIALGGYQPDEYPIFDHHLQLRFAVRYRLYESRRLLAMIRLFENEWMRADVVKSVITRFHELRMNMAGSVVPRWWARLSPMIMENHRRLSNRDSGCEVSGDELEAETGIALPQVNPAALQALRLSLGGY